MTSAIRASDVCFAYGHKPVLEGVSLEVEKGEMVGFIGPNGAGKTTLLQVLSGNLRPQSGEVYIDGQDIRELRHRERAMTVAMVAQNPIVPPGFTALDLVLMGRNPHLGVLQWEGRKDVEIALRAMKLTGMEEFACRLVSSLSGGERQRVFIARALAQEAPVLLLDEPTAHLDIGYQGSILDMVKTIQREAGITVIAAMHDLTLAGEYCDRMAILHQGGILAFGRPEEVLKQELLQQAFGAEVYIISHPEHGTPVVLPRGKEGRDGAYRAASKSEGNTDGKG